MKFPLVSILVPAYNHVHFIEECLDSVFAETYPNKELVIIDDGSSDGTDEKIASWVEKHSDVLNINYSRRENRGLSSTLNDLASRAKGEFLKPTSSDDYLLQGGLLAQVEFLSRHPDKLATVSDYVVVDENGVVIHSSGLIGLHRARKSNYLSSEGIREQIVSKWAFGGPVQMLRRSVTKVVGGWNEDLRFEDWDFFLRLAAIDAVIFSDLKVCAYRLHGKNTCRPTDKNLRIANLQESHYVASKHLVLFNGASRSMLQAQRFLIDAKIAYLKRLPFRVAVNMTQFLFFRGVAKFKQLFF